MAKALPWSLLKIHESSAKRVPIAPAPRKKKAAPKKPKYPVPVRPRSSPHAMVPQDDVEIREMERMIRRFHGDDSAWYQTYSTSSESKAQPRSFRSALGDDLIGCLRAANDAGLNVSMAINEITGDKRQSENVTKIHAVFIDIDDDANTLQSLKALPLPPHIVIQTSPGRLHAYWFVTGCPVSQFSAVQKALAKRFDTDHSVSDLARAMRLAGTHNRKYGNAFLCKIVHELTSAPVSVSTVIRKLKLDVNAVPDATAKNAKLTLAKSHTSAGHKRLVVSDTLLARIRAALDAINPDDRWIWLVCGMALHSKFASEKGYDLWTAWSKRSEKFDEKDQLKTWNRFKSGGGVNLCTLFWIAKQSGATQTVDAMSLAKIFVATFREKLKYDAENLKWYFFTGSVWKTDRQAPLRLAKALIEDLTMEHFAGSASIRPFRSPGGLTQIKQLAELELQDMGITDADFDQNKNALAVPNGVIDLQTTEFRLATANDRLRNCAGVEFDAEAECPKWKKFIDQVTQGDAKLAAFLCRAVGYTLFGHTDEQEFFVIEGSGGNGKGVFLRVLRRLLGQYAAELAPNLLTSAYSGNANSSTSALVALKGIRLGVVTE